MAENQLARAISIIESLVRIGDPVGPRAIAREAEIDRSAVGRILQQLVELDVLVGTDGKYEVGPRLFTMARAVSSLDTLPIAASSVLSALVGEYDETSYVCTLHGSEAVFLYESQSSKPLRYVVELGKPVPLHAGAAGRAILAGLAEPVAKDLLSKASLDQVTDETVSDIEELLRRRSVDVERGFSISREERVEGGAAVAAPFYDSSGQCQGSIVLTSPLTRFATYDSEQSGESIRDAAAMLSIRLGAPNGGARWSGS